MHAVSHFFQRTKFLDNSPDKSTPRSFSLAVKHSSESYSHPVHLLVLISSRTAKAEKLRVSLMTETDRGAVSKPLTFPGWAEDGAGRDAISVGTRNPLRSKEEEGNNAHTHNTRTLAHTHAKI